jgi:hypothetical protein
VHNKLALEEKEARSGEFLCGEVFPDVISASDERLMRFSRKLFPQNFAASLLWSRRWTHKSSLLLFAFAFFSFLSLLPSLRFGSINKFAHH